MDEFWEILSGIDEETLGRLSAPRRQLIEFLIDIYLRDKEAAKEEPGRD